MSTEQLSAADLLDNSVSTTAAAKAEALVNASTYATTALLAMAKFHADNDDHEGALLLQEFAERFAIHEAATL